MWRWGGGHGVHKCMQVFRVVVVGKYLGNVLQKQCEWGCCGVLVWVVVVVVVMSEFL